MLLYLLIGFIFSLKSEEEVCRLARQSGQLLASCAPHRRQTGQLVSEKATLETQLCIKERELANLLKDLSNNDTLHNNQSGIMVILALSYII